MEYALLARWLVLYATLFTLGLPLVARLLPTATGRGAGLAVPAALVTLSLPAYWVGRLTWGPIALAAGVLTLLAASVLAALDLTALRRGEIRLGVDLDRDAATDAALVFLAGFLFLVAIRAVDPAVHPGGGEKFLDFGLLQTLQRSPVLPPDDFWFANEPVKYYYGGHLTTTLLSWLTGTPPRFAYNLALAGFYAALVSAAFELAGAVGAERGRSRRVAGATAVFFVGLASNLVTAGRFVLLGLPAPLQQPIAEYVAGRTDYTVAQLLAGAESFSYWSASRVIPGTINEFPLFAWLNGDLHAHMMGTPTLLLAAAVGYAYYRTPAAALRRRRVLLLVVIPLLAAWQAIQSTWSFPSVLALGWLAATFAPTDPWTLLPAGYRPRWDSMRGQVADRKTSADGRSDAAIVAVKRELGRVGGALLVAAAAGVVAGLLAAPFLLGAAIGGGERSVEFLGPDLRSGFGSLLLVHGAFVVGLGGFLLSRVSVRRPLLLLGALIAAGYVGYTTGFATLAVSVPLLVLAWVALRVERSIGYETVLVVAGMGLITLVELVYVNEQAGPGRMNTVFKTYMQVWVFLGTAMGAALPALVAEWGSGAEGERRSAASTVPWRRVVAVVLVIGLVAATSVYGVLALGSHFEQRPAGGPTLDATAFVETDHPEQAAAIEWVDDRPGQPTLLEAPGTRSYAGGTDGRDRVMYSWAANPASSLTGVPTVAGWQHEVGYRGGTAYSERVSDVDAMYTGNDSVRESLLEEYEVRYIWVGPSERARYGSISFGEGIEIVHQSGDVTIYEVTESAT
ncbi:DUF2298 domain-containing protein [Halobellus ordinarius]|uniref:DUF2298 domain-containing protein n=1 Tax=Halobellus ordinarius TaxID=3075120 RepID=UPI00287FF735|nr:DUF2298 domain-containing protein [Halobellus sp. ZY16]